MMNTEYCGSHNDNKLAVSGGIKRELAAAKKKVGSLLPIQISLMSGRRK